MAIAVAMAMPRSETGLRTVSGSRSRIVTTSRGYFFRLARYATSPSRSSLAIFGYDFIAGLRAALALRRHLRGVDDPLPDLDRPSASRPPRRASFLVAECLRWNGRPRTSRRCRPSGRVEWRQDLRPHRLRAQARKEGNKNEEYGSGHDHTF